jgi:DNA gyrase subunit A
MAQDGMRQDPGEHDTLGGGGTDGGPKVHNHGRILDLEIQRELQDSYLTYAMSTIMDRALPDVRDGLKPSQRRILYAMHTLRLHPGRKHAKCAMICGETSGRYHPHGESVVYPTLVGMVQDWKMRVPLIDPQGNFGSIDPDPPAAMRYTEARLGQAAGDMLADLELDTVDLQPNYDDTRTEPTVLPSKFPNLLINGGVGIAVGMATSLAPHNPVEILDAIVRVIEKPAITLAELMSDVEEGGEVKWRGVKGPDFPTGGTILGKRGIVDAYSNGRGKLTVRGTLHVEDIPGAKDRKQIVIDQIPYMVGQRTLVETIVEAVKEEQITDVSDVRNESGREAMTRIVIELKKGVDPAVVENQLYQFTPLQDTFSIQNLAIVNRRPMTLGLRELIDCYINHRTEVIRRRTAYLLREAKKRAHILEAMIFAVVNIDEVVRLIRSSTTREEAIQKLMAQAYRIKPGQADLSALPMHRWGKTGDRHANITLDAGVYTLMLTRVQAEAIGSMRLLQLVALEIEKLVGEYADITAQIERYEGILADHQKVLGIIKADCAEMKAKYGTAAIGPRRTRVVEGEADVHIADLIPVEDVALTISHEGYAKRVPIATYRQQGRGGKGIRAGEAKDEDFIEHLFVASTHDDLLCFTNTGRVFKIKVFEVPEMSRTSKGRAFVNLIDLKAGEKTCAYLAIKNFEEGSNYLTFASKGGIVKRTALKEYRNVNKSGIIAVGLKEGDALLDVTLTDGNDDIMLITAMGQAIRFNEEDARLMGRSAAGVKGIELAEGDEVIGVVAVNMVKDADGDLVTKDPSVCLLTICENGYGKRTPIDEYRVQPETGKARSQSRGGKGRQDIDTSVRNGKSVASLAVRENEDVVVVSKGGQLVRVPAASIRVCGRGTQGVRVAGLHEGDTVIAAARVPEGVGADEASEASSGESA